MTYRCRVYASIGEVDVAAWEQVRIACGASIFLDPRYVGALESSMKERSRFWYVIVLDDTNDPVACACVTGAIVDFADFAGPRLSWLLRRLPSALSGLRYRKVMYCGLPVSTGHAAVAVMPSHRNRELLSALDGTVRELAVKTSANAIVYREFGKEDLDWVGPLNDAGYQCVATPPVYFFEAAFPSFEHYSDALISKFRTSIRRSQRKLAQGGITSTVLTDPDEILRTYTPEVHQLYLQARDHAGIKFDEVTVDDLREITRRLGDRMALVLLRQDAVIVGAGWCMQDQQAFCATYAGIDYQKNDDFDLLYNLHYITLDHAMRQGFSRIELGATADIFRARLGCRSARLYIFMKGLGPAMSLFVRCAAPFLFAATVDIPQYNVFKDGVAARTR